MASLAVAVKIAEREAELQSIDEAILVAQGHASRELFPLIPTWVRRQVEEVATLVGESPERARAELTRLGIRFVLHPVYDEGAKPFLRAQGSGNSSISHLPPAPTSLLPAL
jgi:hypothetical protein